MVVFLLIRILVHTDGIRTSRRLDRGGDSGEPGADDLVPGGLTAFERIAATERSESSGQFRPLMKFSMKFSTTGVTFRPIIQSGPNSLDCST